MIAALPGLQRKRGVLRDLSSPHRASKYPQPTFDKALAECKADKSWHTFETTAAGHDVMVDAPEWLVDILLQVS